MNNNNSFFSVKNAAAILFLMSLLLSFTSPKKFSKNNFSTKNSNENYFNPIFKGEKVTELSDKKKLNSLKKVLLKNIPSEIKNQNNFFIPNSGYGNASLVYNSTDNHEGIIGSPDFENWNDEPSDNLYNVNLIQYDENKQYRLVYSVKGVNNSSSVTRSINKSFSLGGYITSKGNSWTAVKEEIDPSLLKQGNNQILFNAINKNNFYSIKDVSIEETTKKNNSFYKITSSIITNNKIYLKGFFSTNSEIKSIQISGKKLTISKNEFEYFDTFSGEQKDLKLKFFKKDGSILETNISKFDIGDQTEVKDFTKPEERIIENNYLGLLIGLRTIDLPPVESSITNVSKEYFGYRFKSNSGEKKVIHLSYDKNKIPKGFHENDIATFAFDYQQKKWLRLNIDSVNTEKQYIVLTIESPKGGETDYVNGIIKNPESPEAASFTPTSTNDIPVANPTSKINMISPPTANQQGSANVSYPIEIPAGVNGFQPNISINYNSDSKSGGWAGIGWDVPMETIDIDTRWGVPEFNPTKESEIYTINGEQIVFNDEFSPNKIPASLWKDRVSGDKQFYFRTGVKEGIKIIRKGTIVIILKNLANVNA